MKEKKVINEAEKNYGHKVGQKTYEEMNDAERMIIDYIQMIEYCRLNHKDFKPCEDIITLKEIAEKLGLIEERPKEKEEPFEMPF